MNCGSTKYGTIRMASFDLNIIKCIFSSWGECGKMLDE